MEYSVNERVLRLGVLGREAEGDVVPSPLVWASPLTCVPFSIFEYLDLSIVYSENLLYDAIQDLLTDRTWGTIFFWASSELSLSL